MLGPRIGKWVRHHRNFRISIVVAILTGILAAASDVRAQTGWDLPEFKEATAAFNRGDCRAAWDFVWPLAKSGNADARLYLLLLVTFNTNPPGLDLMSSAQGEWNRHLLTLSVYATLSRVSRGKGDPDHKWLRDEIPRRLKELGLGVKGDQVAQCYQSGGALSDCLDLAVSLGVIPTFDGHAEEVERAARATGMAASCRDPHRPLKR